MSRPREITAEEARANFLAHCRSMTKYWQDQLLAGRITRDEAISGAVFSVLVAIDGEAAALPGFKLIPSPHPDDQQFCRESGDNWYRPADDDDMDIAGSLHELFYQEGKDARPAGQT